MQTELADFIKNTTQGIEAERILRACVHCGFCNATCPTYQLLGDELDGPRGRIYQIKQVLEGQPATLNTQTHLDRCLTCRNCETTCPSGVEYSKLLDLGREVVAQQVARPIAQRVIRWSLRKLLTTPGMFATAFALGRIVSPVLPAILKAKLPAAPATPGAIQRSRQNSRQSSHRRKVILTEGCVQPTYKPDINIQAARVLDKLGIETITAPQERCCGAVSFHLDAQAEAKQLMRRNIDAWWPYIEAGAEAIVSSASGCGVMIKDYAQALAQDPVYREKARKVTALTCDLSEMIDREDLTPFATDNAIKVAFQSPCTLQHGQKLSGKVERILSRAGYTLIPVSNPHFCCGAAGTYSILQKSLSKKLQKNKIDSLQQGKPAIIATANIGCQIHLEAVTDIPVKHWIQLLDSGVDNDK